MTRTQSFTNLEKKILVAGTVLGGIGTVLGALYLNEHLNTEEPKYLFESFVAGLTVPLTSLGIMGYKLVKDYETID